MELLLAELLGLAAALLKLHFWSDFWVFLTLLALGFSGTDDEDEAEDDGELGEAADTETEE